MLLRKGLDPNQGGIDYWDRWHRRESTEQRHLLKRGQDVWWEAPSTVKALHEQHAHDSLVYSKPLVILAVGSSAQAWMSQASQELHGVVVDTVRIQIHTHGGMIQRLVVGCPHPETMFFPQASLYGKLMDDAINFAVGLAGLSGLPMLKHYFSGKARDMEERKSISLSTGILRGRESRVIAVAGLRRFEVQTGATLGMEQIPELITWVYAREMNVEHSVAGLESTLKPGETLCASILRVYAAKSHEVMKAKDWSNLKKALEVQEAGNWRSLRDAAMSRMAAADERKSSGEQVPTVSRAEHRCEKCPDIFKSRQGLWEHRKKVHEGHLFKCPFQGCEKTLKSRSGMSKHVKVHPGAGSSVV